MPNWVAQDFHVAGPKAEVDRFIRTGYSRRHRGQFDDLLLFDELCPNRGRERRAPQSVPWLPPSAFARSAPADAPQPWRRRSGGRTRKALDPGVVLGHFRTRTQGMFSMQTRWDYPVEFYNQLPKHWPALSFAASVNEEIGAFGGTGAPMRCGEMGGTGDRRGGWRARSFRQLAGGGWSQILRRQGGERD
jgi:hypothetical protein